MQYTEVSRELGTGARSLCSVKVALADKEIKIVNLYYPAGDTEGDWIRLQGDPHCLVVGDFNERSAMWEDGSVIIITHKRASDALYGCRTHYIRDQCVIETHKISALCIEYH